MKKISELFQKKSMSFANLIGKVSFSNSFSIRFFRPKIGEKKSPENSYPGFVVSLEPCSPVPPPVFPKGRFFCFRSTVPQIFWKTGKKKLKKWCSVFIRSFTLPVLLIIFDFFLTFQEPSGKRCQQLLVLSNYQPR